MTGFSCSSPKSLADIIVGENEPPFLESLFERELVEDLKLVEYKKSNLCCPSRAYLVQVVASRPRKPLRLWGQRRRRGAWMKALSFSLNPHFSELAALQPYIVLKAADD